MELDGLDMMVVIGEDNLYSPPTLDYCMQYAESHDVDPANTYVDNSQGQSWRVLFGAMDNYAAGSLGLPWNGLLDARSMEYVFNDYAGEGTLRSNVCDLLELSPDECDEKFN